MSSAEKKLCMSCRHFEDNEHADQFENLTYGGVDCKHPNNYGDELVYGGAMLINNPQDLRLASGGCGPHGDWWEVSGVKA